MALVNRYNDRVREKNGLLDEVELKEQELEGAVNKLEALREAHTAETQRPALSPPPLTGRSLLRRRN